MFGTHLFIHSIYLFDNSYAWINENLDYGKIKDDVCSLFPQSSR